MKAILKFNRITIVLPVKDVMDALRKATQLHDRLGLSGEIGLEVIRA